MVAPVVTGVVALTARDIALGLAMLLGLWMVSGYLIGEHPHPDYRLPLCGSPEDIASRASAQPIMVHAGDTTLFCREDY